MLAYCINLKQREDRWNKFISQEFPFEVNRFDAIKGGSCGCLNSHIEVLKKCVDEILIFEDDCEVICDWSVFFDAYSQLPEDWDMLYMGANVHQKLKRFSENLFYLRSGWSTHGILYSKKMADALIKNKALRSAGNIDTFYAQKIQPNYRCFIIYPLFSIQTPGHSDIINDFRGCYDMIPNYEKNTR